LLIGLQILIFSGPRIANPREQGCNGRLFDDSLENLEKSLFFSCILENSRKLRVKFNAKTQMINELKFHFNVVGEHIDTLEDNILILDNPVRDKTYTYPFSTDCVCGIVVQAGGLDCRIDMEQYHVRTTGILVILLSQVVENLSFSDDFKGVLVLYSKSFLESLSISDAFSRFLSVKSSPFSPVEGESLVSLMNYVQMLRNTIRHKDHPYRLEVARLLTKAFCLGLGYYIHPEQPKDFVSRADEISKAFLDLVKQHCMEERGLGFYADKLCISIKHLSSMLSKSTGKSPSKWIEDYTILKAKQLLSTTKESVANISEMMSFRSQSDFGKYFKRHTGFTPLEFRDSERGL